MYMLRGLADVDYGTCVSTNCDTIDPHAFLDAGGNLTDKYQAAYGACINACASGAESGYGVPRPTTTPINPTTTMPGSLSPPPGYQPNVPTNWWRIASAVALGLVAATGIFLVTRESRHAA